MADTHPAPGPAPESLTAEGILDSCRALARRMETSRDPWSLEPERLALESGWSEDQAWSHIRFTADTEDPAAAIRFRAWQLELEPAWQQGRRLLDAAFLDAGASTPEHTLARRLAGIRAARLRETRPAEARQAHDTALPRILRVHAGLRIPLGQPGPEPTPAMALCELRSPDRAWREHTWRAIETGWAGVAPELDGLYDMGLAGFVGHPETEGDAPRNGRRRLRQLVLQHTVPLIARQRRLQAQALGLTALRPWDLALDPRAARLLLPWRDTAGLLDAASSCLAATVPEAGVQLDELRGAGLLDLEPRPGKAPGAYTCPLDRSGRSFVFMNAGIGATDLQTLIHETGHVLHTRVCHPLPALDLREVGAEGAELAALTLELLALPATEALWGHPRTARAWRREQLLHAVHRMAQGALLDAFMEEILEGRAHDGASRSECFLRLYTRFLGEGLDLSGCEAAIGRSWQRWPGLLQRPLESGAILLAQTGALSLAMSARDAAEGPRESWLAALALGNSVPIDAVYHRAGLERFPDAASFSGLMAFVRSELEG